MPDLDTLLSEYSPVGRTEAEDVKRLGELLASESEARVWSRAMPLHVTASALVVHPGTGQILLRWHQRQQAWLQVGGHGDPGETDPLAIALREATEETGLTDLVPWPDGRLWHAVIVQVPANATEPAHEHADLRFVFATDDPGAVRPETADAPLRWLSLPEALALTAADNLRETIHRLAPSLAHR